MCESLKLTFADKSSSPIHLSQSEKLKLIKSFFISLIISVCVRRVKITSKPHAKSEMLPNFATADSHLMLEDFRLDFRRV